MRVTTRKRPFGNHSAGKQHRCPECAERRVARHHTQRRGISGGSAANVVADHAVAELDVRFWENDEYDRVNQALEALCEKAFRRRDDDADAGQSQTGDGSKRCDSGTDAAG